jgi:chorismate synthase
MSTLSWRTAGESHGPMLVALIEGVPAGLALDEAFIAREMKRRQQGFGRGGRMRIESDEARIVSGVRHGRTTGAPIALLIENRDHANWATRLKAAPLAEGESAGPRVTLPRPGHADLAGAIKYRAEDVRDVLERASARETAARVALGAIAKALLAAVDIHVGSQVRSLHEAESPAWDESVPEARVDARRLNERADTSPVRCADEGASGRMVQAIEAAQRRRDTVGGVFELVATGVPPGLGSYVQWDRRLDARLVRAVTSIPAVKAAEVGDGWAGAHRYGTEVHDPILREGTSIVRGSNHAGGTEGGITNGEPVVVRGAMKPIATVSNALPSVDLVTGEADTAHIERSDTCAVPAAAVVGETMLALTLAESLLETYGGDTVVDLRHQVRRAWRRARRLAGHVFLCGLSGVGKSSVGPPLAAALDRPFIDLDDAIAASSGMTIAELFRVEGEEAFRRRESEAIWRAVASPEPSVISLGGGTVLSPDNRDRLRRGGDVLWLRAPVETLAQRLGDADGRPLLTGDVRAMLAGLEAVRGDLYRLVTDAVVDAEAPVGSVVQRCLGALGALS